MSQENVEIAPQALTREVRRDRPRTKGSEAKGGHHARRKTEGATPGGSLPRYG